MSRGLSAQQHQFLAALEVATSELRPDYYQVAAELAGIPSREELLEVGPPLSWGLPMAPEDFAEWDTWWGAALRKHHAVSSSMRRSVQSLAERGHLEIGWHKNSGLLLVRKIISEEDMREYATLEKQALYYRSVRERGGNDRLVNAALRFAAKYMVTTGIPPSDVHPARYIDRAGRSR